MPTNRSSSFIITLCHSIASGVAGLLAASAAVIKFLDTAKSNIQDAPRTIIWALAEVTDVRSAIVRLNDLIQDLGSVPQSARTSVGIHDTVVAVSELVISFDCLVAILKPFSADGAASLNKWDKVKWLPKQDDVVRYVRQLQTHKVSITLILNMLQCESDIVIRESQLALCTKIDAVLEDSEMTRRRIEGLEEQFNKFTLSNASLFSADRISLAPTLARAAESDNRTIRSSTEQHTRSGSSTPPTDPTIRLEFETTLQETRVYRRAHHTSDAFSLVTAYGRSVAGSVMTSYSLADSSSILTAFPIMSRTELQHPEFYKDVAGDERLAARLLKAIATQGVASPATRDDPPSPFALRNVRPPPNCGPNVMGRWNRTVRKTWRASEFRTEVQFDVPVLFVCSTLPGNGLLKDTEIHYIDGSPLSIDATWIDSQDDPRFRDLKHTWLKHMRTADDEQATWLTLLSSLQRMEYDSRDWVASQQGRPALTKFIGEASLSLPLKKDPDTLMVAFQRKRMSWDSMPVAVRRPYAITTMSHMVEILAMMGIFWVEYNRTHHVYRAEGNGFLVTGHLVDSVGIMFDFHRTGRNDFTKNRAMPVPEIRQLCFGRVPTFKPLASGRIRPPGLESDLREIRLSTRADIARTLTMMGCNSNTANYFHKEEARTCHIFPITLEMIGMIAKLFHTEEPGFRYLPNPSIYAWDTTAFYLPNLLDSYRRLLLQIPPLSRPLGRYSRRSGIHLLFGYLLELFRGDTVLGNGALHWSAAQGANALHRAIWGIDSTLEAWVGDPIGTELLEPPYGKSDHLKRILVAHFQEVPRLMNEPADQQSDTESDTAETDGCPRFEDLGAAAPKQREDWLMEIYFKRILPAVMREVPEWSEVPQEDTTAASSKNGGAPELSTGDIWCFLVLRMICWLMLHGFHPDDVQIPKGEDSQLLVYIS
ncbi:hypothetical protein ACJ41O_000296 [Fusarium nematophilum]